MVTTETVYSVVKDAANVNVILPGGASVDRQSVDDSGDFYLLQRFSAKWSTFVDVQSLEDVVEGDKLTLTLQVNNQNWRCS